MQLVSSMSTNRPSQSLILHHGQEDGDYCVLALLFVDICTNEGAASSNPLEAVSKAINVKSLSCKY